MKIDIDKCLSITGDNHKYQYLMFICAAMCWFSVDFVSICFPLLQILPVMECQIVQNGSWSVCVKQTAKDFCKLYGVRPKEIIYRNIITDYELWCDTKTNNCNRCIFYSRYFNRGFFSI